MKIGIMGPAKNTMGGEVHSKCYMDGSTALVIYSDKGKEAVATVCLAPTGPVAEEGFVWLKGWSENKGIPEALEKAGIVKRTGETYPTGHVMAELAEILIQN